MENKQIVFTAPCKAELLDKAMPEPTQNNVLVKLAVSSISSGTERANLIGDTNISTVEKYTEAKFPRYGGYSSSGIVEKTGSAVTSVKPGDRVALSWSTHSRYVCIPESRVYKLSDSIDFNSGALVHIATFPLAAIRKCRLEVGESALVMGLGVLGLIAVQLLRAAGAIPVIAVDPSSEKRERALKFGADFAFDPNSPDFAKNVKSVTGGGAKVIIEVTGLGRGLDQALDCVARFGRVALLGCTRHSDFTIDYYRKVHGPGITLIGAHTNARPSYESSGGWWIERDDALALLALQTGGRINLGNLVEDIYSPEDAPKVYARLATEPSFPITQFDWRKLK
jgi:2-desacetyl-2-hydroxyethyl bacteriochlorophyllide A dehydrogenase